MGETRSIDSGRENASTLAVPAMNMTEMSGAASQTERRMDLATSADRHSPANMPTESKPPKAPKPIFPNKLRLRSESAGTLKASGAVTGGIPEAPWNQRGTATTTIATNSMTMAKPPKLFTHFPTPRPRQANSISPQMAAKLIRMIAGLLEDSHAPDGPKA